MKGGNRLGVKIIDGKTNLKLKYVNKDAVNRLINASNGMASSKILNM